MQEHAELSLAPLEHIDKHVGMAGKSWLVYRFPTYPPSIVVGIVTVLTSVLVVKVNMVVGITEAPIGKFYRETQYQLMSSPATKHEGLMNI